MEYDQGEHSGMNMTVEFRMSYNYTSSYSDGIKYEQFITEQRNFTHKKRSKVLISIISS